MCPIGPYYYMCVQTHHADAATRGVFRLPPAADTHKKGTTPSFLNVHHRHAVYFAPFFDIIIGVLSLRRGE